jgi:hypothetical protein
MAKGRIRNRLELRAEYEAAAAREVAGRQSREGSEDEAAEEEEEEDEVAEEGEIDENAPVVKKKKAAAKEAKPKRPRTAKQVRQRVVWVVFDNSHKPTRTFEYTQRKEADAYAAQMTAEKKSTYFVQPVKEEVKG